MHVYSIIIRIAHLRTFARVCIIINTLKTKVLIYSTSLKGVDFEERRCRFLHLWTQHYLVIFPSCENSIHFENLRNLMAIIFELRYGRLKYSHLEYLNSR